MSIFILNGLEKGSDNKYSATSSWLAAPVGAIIMLHHLSKWTGQSSWMRWSYGKIQTQSDWLLHGQWQARTVHQGLRFPRDTLEGWILSQQHKSNTEMIITFSYLQNHNVLFIYLFIISWLFQFAKACYYCTAAPPDRLDCLSSHF